MLKICKLLFIISGLFLLVSCKSVSTKHEASPQPNALEEPVSNDENYDVYYKATDTFISLDLKTLSSGEMSKPAFIYFGRASCPYCRSFAPWLSTLAIKNNWTIYSVDTEAFDETMKNEIKDNYLVEEVPTLIYIDSNNTIARPDDDKNVSMEEWIKERY